MIFGDREAGLIASALPNLIYLDITSKCEIGDLALTRISEKLKYLSFLYVGKNKFSTNGLRAITSNLRNLTYLNFDSNKAECDDENISTKEGKDTLSKLTNLSFISFRCCKKTHGSVIRDMTKLDSFNYS